MASVCLLLLFAVGTYHVLRMFLVMTTMSMTQFSYYGYFTKQKRNTINSLS